MKKFFILSLTVGLATPAGSTWAVEGSDVSGVAELLYDCQRNGYADEFEERGNRAGLERREEALENLRRVAGKSSIVYDHVEFWPCNEKVIPLDQKCHLECVQYNYVAMQYLISKDWESATVLAAKCNKVAKYGGVEAMPPECQGLAP